MNKLKQLMLRKKQRMLDAIEAQENLFTVAVDKIEKQLEKESKEEVKKKPKKKTKKKKSILGKVKDTILN